MTDTTYLALSAALAWVMLLFASLARARGWTRAGMRVALGNRDDVPDASPLAARADRAAKNMLENLVLFVAVLAAARLAGASSEDTTLGTAIFFWARVVYFGLYVAGVAYLRTAIWGVGVFGMVLIGIQAFR